MVGMGQSAPTQKKIHIEHSDSTEFEKDFNPDIYVLRGNVVFRHDSTFMYCDSAYLYDKVNSLEAFDNVRIEQGDTLFIYGDYLNYHGNTAIAELRYNVRMENNDVTLLTDSFNYDRNKDIVYYLEGGILIDSLNELSSNYGQYELNTKLACFQENVRLNNPNFVLTSDTLNYDTNTKIATITGPSIIESDDGWIYSSLGWYNTETEESKLYDRSTVVSEDKNKFVTADSMYFNRLSGDGEAFSNILINDTAKKFILTGNYSYFNEKTDFAFVTDSAQFIEYSQKDSLFLHGDTLLLLTVGENDREIKAFYGVRFYRTDLQGICDSMQFNTRDSLLYLIQDPVLWNTDYQITGDTIVLFFNDSTIDRVHVINHAFATEQVDSTYFNQLKGKLLYAYFDGGELYRVDVDGNAETIYYPVDAPGVFIARNKTESSFFSVTVENREPVKIVIWPSSSGTSLPLPDLTPESKFLKDFYNYDYLRPVDKSDIFIKKHRKKEDTPPPRKIRNFE
jgi:lipopolysaccharide assembly outer membrane protein LptD (OstA)